MPTPSFNSIENGNNANANVLFAEEKMVHFHRGLLSLSHSSLKKRSTRNNWRIKSQHSGEWTMEYWANVRVPTLSVPIKFHYNAEDIIIICWCVLSCVLHELASNLFQQNLHWWCLYFIDIYLSVACYQVKKRRIFRLSNQIIFLHWF